ncbi:MAG: hypothetical protein KUF72_13225 [Candidatus Thiodiazotropha sp. (ex Ctena orbiculata)]|nr:hypothetical protein [Candidatus Thiodiazotropha taylori]
MLVARGLELQTTVLGGVTARGGGMDKNVVSPCQARNSSLIEQIEGFMVNKKGKKIPIKQQ